MWNSLLFFYFSAFLLAGVSTGPVKQTIIVNNNANAASSAAASGGQGGGGGSSAGASSAASSGSTTIIKNEKNIINCAKNERYEQCPERMCEPQLCDEEPVASCSSVQNSSQTNCSGPPACVCIADYVRNDCGACIPIQNCGNQTEPEPTEDGTCGTEPPVTKTPAPGTETPAPGTGTTAPGTGTPAPETRTPAPSTETPAPSTGTPAPGTKTTAPGTGTPAPGTGTPAPSTETPAPSTETPAPSTGTPAPGTKTSAPGTGTPAPGTRTPAPSTETPAPSTGTPAPGNKTSAPGTGTPAPGTRTPAPGTGTPAPGTGTPAPSSETPAPSTGTPAPSTETPAPSTETPAPSTGTPAPGTKTSAPGTGTPAPGTRTPAPSTETPAPSTETPAPSTGTPAPGTKTSAPGTGTPAPGTRTPAPGTGTPAPGTGTPAPSTETPAPSTGTPAPGTKTSAPGTGTPAPGTRTPAPGTGTPAPGTGTPAPGTRTPAPCTGTPVPGTGTPAPGTRTPAPVTEDQEPGTGTPTLGTGSTAPGTVTTAPVTKTTAPGTPSTSTPTTKGPNECRGKNEWYFKCPPACPQKTCSEYLNGTSCSPKTYKSCVGECRCLIGFFRDDSGNCLSGWECREAAKPTTRSPLTDPGSPFSDECSSFSSFLGGIMAFTPKLLDSLMKRNPGNDVLVGGTSILFMLAQVALYAKDAPKQEILKALRFKDTEQIRCFFPRFAVELRDIANDADLDFDYFCKIYADDRCRLTSQFKDEIEELFTVRPGNLNFTAPGSAQQINNEVAQFTNNSIDNFVKPKVLSALDSLMMADALSFKGEWLRPFNPKDTELKYFFGPKKVVKKLIMHQRTKILYYDSLKLDAQMIKLPYKADTNFKFGIILPRTIHGLPDLLNRLKNGDEVAKAFLAAREEEVDIYLPKFNVTVANLLKIPTESANVSLIFNNETAGLENVASCDKPYVSEILQKITVQVDESGVGSRIVDFPVPDEPTTPRPSSYRVYYFNANRPFIFYLFYHNLLLASGAIVS